MSDELLQEIDKTINITRDNCKMIINIALNYGGRKEIIENIKKILHDIQIGSLDVKNLNESIIERYLNTEELLDPDLIIRTSGESRLSNFLLWQAANTELFINKKLWPDFTKEDLQKTIIEYNKRIKG